MTYINPYACVSEGTGRWLRTNFHTHAGTGKDTCGMLSIDEVVEFYKMAGYGVLTISNHDLFSDVSEFEKKHDILLINGFEYSQEGHMLCIGGDSVNLSTHQEAIDACNAQGGFAILCHPNWIHKEYWPWKEIDALNGYLGIEIMNGVISRLSGSGLATDTWDYLLSQRKLVWGFGDDDFHRWFDMAKAWNMIYTVPDQEDGQGCSHQKVLDSIHNGSFYVSTGLVIKDFSVQDNRLDITATAGDTYVTDYQYLFIGEGGRILDQQQGASGRYKIQGDEAYVRVQVISEHGAMLWTQPVYAANGFERP